MTPSQIQFFSEAIHAADSSVIVEIDAPDSATGTWFIDVFRDSERFLTLEWREANGFGLHTGDSSLFGERPCEVFRTPEKASRRVLQLLSNKGEKNSAWLKEIRELNGFSQVDLARLLTIQQSAISKLENRRELKMSTLAGYVGAMGGRLTIQVQFDDCELPISIESGSIDLKAV
jgi:DNA-binding XRE family transcriptional regulator